MQENYRYEWNTFQSATRDLPPPNVHDFLFISLLVQIPASATLCRPFTQHRKARSQPQRHHSSLMDLSGDEVCQISTADSSKRATEMWSTPSGLTSASRFQGSSGSPSCQFAVDQLHFPDLVQISELHQLQRAAPHLLSQLQPSHQLLRCLIEILLCAAPSKYRLQMVLKRTVSRLCARLRSGTFQSKT